MLFARAFCRPLASFACTQCHTSGPSRCTAYTDSRHGLRQLEPKGYSGHSGAFLGTGWQASVMLLRQMPIWKPVQAGVLTCSDHRKRHLPATAGEVAGRLMDSPDATSSSTSLYICMHVHCWTLSCLPNIVRPLSVSGPLLQTG